MSACHAHAIRSRTLSAHGILPERPSLRCDPKLPVALSACLRAASPPHLASPRPPPSPTSLPPHRPTSLPASHDAKVGLASGPGLRHEREERRSHQPARMYSAPAPARGMSYYDHCHKRHEAKGFLYEWETIYRQYGFRFGVQDQAYRPDAVINMIIDIFIKEILESGSGLDGRDVKLPYKWNSFTNCFKGI